MIYEEIDEFKSKINISDIILGIDYGAKKIGLAISTPSNSMALPLAILRNDPQIFEQIAKIINQKKIKAIVIGLPVTTIESQSAKNIILFAQKLSNLFQLPIYLQDERRTSKAADSLLKIAGFNRKERNSMDDSIAASLILESTLIKLKNC